MVVCDKCGKDFAIHLKNTTKQINGNSVVYNYMQCPKCDAVFFAFIESERSEQLKDEINKLLEYLSVSNRASNPNLYERIANKIAGAKHKLRIELKQNERKYRKYFENNMEE